MTEPVKPLLPKHLFRVCSADIFPFETTAELEDLKVVLGQPRAVEALRFGIGIQQDGYNIFALGPEGTGKHSIVGKFFSEQATEETAPHDICYVNNFKDPYCPKRIHLKKGGAIIFRNEIAQLIEEARNALIRAFESKEYANKRQSVIDEFKQQEAELFTKIYKKAQENNFAISRTPIEIIVVPIDDKGNPTSDTVFKNYTKEKQDDILRKRDMIMEELKSLLRVNRELERERNNALLELDDSVSNYAIELLLEELREKYKENSDVLEHLEEIKSDITNNLTNFLGL